MTSSCIENQDKQLNCKPPSVSRTTYCIHIYHRNWANVMDHFTLESYSQHRIKIVIVSAPRLEQPVPIVVNGTRVFGILLFPEKNTIKSNVKWTHFRQHFYGPTKAKKKKSADFTYSHTNNLFIQKRPRNLMANLFDVVLFRVKWGVSPKPLNNNVHRPHRFK